MSEILSQAEIDELLSALMGGGDEPEEKKDEEILNVKSYDFRTANRFPKEQIRTFNVVFQNFAQLFSNRMTTILRSACECEILSVEEISFNEFNNSLPTPVILVVFKAPPMKGSLLMEISPECGYMIVNKLLGGGSNISDTTKQFTEIDLALLERVLKQALHTFNEAWDKIIPINTSIERIETSPQFTQVCASNEPVSVITLNTKIGEESGLISICLPHTAVEPIAKQLTTRMYYQASGSQDDEYSEEQFELIADKLMKTKVSMLAFFNDTPATVMDVYNLQAGDVIRLDHKLSEPLMVKVQHIPKFKAKIGTMGKNYALQIIDVVKEEEKDESFSGRN